MVKSPIVLNHMNIFNKILDLGMKPASVVVDWKWSFWLWFKVSLSTYRAAGAVFSLDHIPLVLSSEALEKWP